MLTLSFNFSHFWYFGCCGIVCCFQIFNFLDVTLQVNFDMRSISIGVASQTSHGPQNVAREYCVGSWRSETRTVLIMEILTAHVTFWENKGLVINLLVMFEI